MDLYGIYGVGVHLGLQPRRLRLLCSAFRTFLASWPLLQWFEMAKPKIWNTWQVLLTVITVIKSYNTYIDSSSITVACSKCPGFHVQHKNTFTQRIYEDPHRDSCEDPLILQHRLQIHCYHRRLGRQGCFGAFASPSSESSRILEDMETSAISK